jgi:ABC-type multidrug transport system fused ATPase/permease subunit
MPKHSTKFKCPLLLFSSCLPLPFPLSFSCFSFSILLLHKRCFPLFLFLAVSFRYFQSFLPPLRSSSPVFNSYLLLPPAPVIYFLFMFIFCCCCFFFLLIIYFTCLFVFQNEFKVQQTCSSLFITKFYEILVCPVQYFADRFLHFF